MAGMRTAWKVGALAAGLAAGACALVAPRWGDASVAERWELLREYRYAHRGLHDNRTPAPENSLAAFRLAREAGYGSELDVHLSSDGVPVVIHDSELLRVCGTQGRVEDKTERELTWLRLLGTKEKIPTLAQVLEAYESGVGDCPPLIVEIKTTRQGVGRLMEATLAVLDAHDVPYCVESFDPRVLVWLRRHRPDVVRGQLSEDFSRDEEVEVNPLAGALHAALLTNVATRPDFIAYHFSDRGHPSLAVACGLLGAHLAYWTLQSPEELAVADDDGALAIFEGFEA